MAGGGRGWHGARVPVTACITVFSCLPRLLFCVFVGGGGTVRPGVWAKTHRTVSATACACCRNPKSRSSGSLGRRLQAPGCTSAPGAIATTPERTRSPHGDSAAASSPSSAAHSRGPPPPPPHPRSGTPPLPHASSSARAAALGHPQRSPPAAAHALAQPSPVAGSGHRGPFTRANSRGQRGHAAPHAPGPSHGGHSLPPGPPDMVPRPASAFAAHTVHAGMPTGSSSSTAMAAQPFTYHTVHAALQMWASEELETPPARPVQHAPAHANSHLTQRPQPSLPPPQIAISRSPSPDIVPPNDQTLVRTRPAETLCASRAGVSAVSAIHVSLEIPE